MTKEEKSVYMKKWHKSKITHFVVYKHINANGDVYIGCGNNLRPYGANLSNRSKYWFEAFTNGYEIEILKEFSNRELALKYEKKLIEEIGLNNLVNKRKD
jgi:hypothetical protein